MNRCVYLWIFDMGVSFSQSIVMFLHRSANM